MARKRIPPHRSGFLNIDKPPGWTSHDVVSRIRRITGVRQVGHAGTLDPAASGVLPVAVGHATRMLPFIEDAGKTYIANIRFGIASDSGDRDGRLIGQRDTADLTREQIEREVALFRGHIRQTPPLHSAVKVDGHRLYELARKGIDADVPTRDVTVHAIDLVDWHCPEAVLRIDCSKGTYVRSIARDLGERTGSGAMLVNLVRVRAGRFGLASSVSIHHLEARIAQLGWRWVALHPDAVVVDRDAITLTADEEPRWFNGMPVERSGVRGNVRVYDSRGEWIGSGDVRPGTPIIDPKRVVRGSSV